jgi:hypothetical protein
MMSFAVYARPQIIIRCGSSKGKRRRAYSYEWDLPESHDGGSPAARFRGRVPESVNKFAACEHGADNLALDADTAAVNDAKGTKSEAARLEQVLLDDSFYISRRDAVQVEDVRDGNAYGVVTVHKTENPASD